MKKLYIVSLIVLFLIVGFLGITYSYEYNVDDLLIFKLNGDVNINLLVGEDYIEYGASVVRGADDISYMLKIDNSVVNTNRVGIYKVKYEIVLDGYSEYIYRNVRVYENVKPIIKLNGDDVVFVKLNEVYYEPGYEVTDNYDKNLVKDVIIIGNVDVNKIGEYEIQYLVSDSSGNIGKAFRKVIICE